MIIVLFIGLLVFSGYVHYDQYKRLKRAGIRIELKKDRLAAMEASEKDNLNLRWHIKQQDRQITGMHQVMVDSQPKVKGEIYRSPKSSEWRFRFVGKNGRKIDPRDSYKRLAGAKKAVGLFGGRIPVKVKDAYVSK